MNFTLSYNSFIIVSKFSNYKLSSSSGTTKIKIKRISVKLQKHIKLKTEKHNQGGNEKYHRNEPKNERREMRKWG